jgi:hypothetical protein
MKLTKFIESVPHGFVLNIDETWFSDFFDARQKKSIARGSHPFDSVPILIQGNLNWRRSLVVQCPTAPQNSL